MKKILLLFSIFSLFQVSFLTAQTVQNLRPDSVSKAILKQTLPINLPEKTTFEDENFKKVVIKKGAIIDVGLDVTNYTWPTFGNKQFLVRDAKGQERWLGHCTSEPAKSKLDEIKRRFNFALEEAVGN